MTQPPSITMQPPATSTGLVDLETELSCSICTDILYQPLTLLDCLHTFCGSCLKIWFSSQRRNADHEHERSRQRRRRKPYSYTCPSCRAAVKQTRPNATVTTLLDMYITANPARRKTQEDKSSIAQTYRPGEDVIIQPNLKRTVDQAVGDNEQLTDSAGEEDRRLVEQVQQMSLRDMGMTNDAVRRGRAHGESPSLENANPRQSSSNHEQRTQHPNRAVQLGHQSSLRSLLSPNDSNEMKEEILRQIAEEGLLDDVDWDNMQVEQEDEISERIAEAYRRRRRHRSRQRGERQGRHSRSREHARASSTQYGARHSRNSSSSARPSGESQLPPVSRPHLFESATSEPRRHARSSSQGAVSLSRSENPSNLVVGSSVLNTRERPRSREARTERTGRSSHDHRRSTDPDGVPASEQWRMVGATPTAHPRTRPERRRASQPSSAPPTRVSFDMSAGPTQPRPTSPQQQPAHPHTFPPQPHAQYHGQPRTSSIDAPTPTITVSCDRCHRPNIQSTLHYTCTRCGPPGSTFDLCLQCYRLGRGCLHWFGFGHAAWHRWEKKAGPGSEPLHVLRSQKYVDPLSLPEAERLPNTNLANGKANSSLLQLGVFCDICHENANTCYWHCAQCNDGEWGYCHSCVNRGRHCSHPLLPVALESSTPTMAPAVTDANDPKPPSPHSSTPTPVAQLHPLILSTNCNICTSSIYTHEQRLHCPDCSNGDYDVCIRCYERLTASGGIISLENGLDGQRKCSNGPNGHHMLLVDFAISEGAEGYAWRRVLEGPVGGWGQELKAPMNGRAKGKRVEAIWPWIPDESGDEDLSFPRAALVEEVVDVNDEFSWGVFCRRGGYFPSAYVRSL